MLPPGSDAFQIFTDGSFDAKARTGGWAYVVMDGGHPVHSARGTGTGPCNNTFEVMAAVEALSWLDTCALKQAVILWTDSSHVVEGCTRWRAVWRNNGWKRIDPNPRARRRAIPGMQVWQQLDALLIRNPNVTISWCKAHSGIMGNEHADALAYGKARASEFRNWR